MTAKIGLGLDHNETHSRHGWHRDASFVMLAFAMMAAIRPDTPKRMRRTMNALAAADPLVDTGIRRIAV